MKNKFYSISELSQYIEACIQENATTLDYETLLSEIEHLGESETPEGIEAAILLGYFLKQNAKKTFMLLAKYREYCQETSGAVYFESFRERCELLVSPRTLTPHGYRIPIGTGNTTILTEGIILIERAMKKIGYDIFINSGTLLGVIRSGAFIPHDDDVDFGVLLHASDAASAAAEWIELKNTLESNGLLKNVGWLGGILKTHKIGTFTVDFFPAWVEGGTVFVYPHTAGDLVLDDLFPLRVSDDLGLPIPNKPEKMLAVNYGPDWRTPDPLFKFNFGKHRKKFAPFLTITKLLDAREAKI